MTWAKDMMVDGSTSVGPQPSEWDIVYLGGEILPGIATVTVTTAGDIDERKSAGARLSTPIDKGEKCAKVNISLVVMPSMYDRLRQVIAPILRPQTKTGAREPMAIQHPLCELWGIGVVMVESATTPNPESGGTMTVQLQCIEWTPAPKPAKNKGKVKGPPTFYQNTLQPDPTDTTEQKNNLYFFAAGEFK